MNWMQPSNRAETKTQYQSVTVCLTHTHTSHPPTQTHSGPKQKCEEDVLSLWNRCPRVQGMCSGPLPVHKQNGMKLLQGSSRIQACARARRPTHSTRPPNGAIRSSS